MDKYFAVHLTGSCRTATDRAGTLYHAVLASEYAPEYPQTWGVAICGRKPGKRSNGWSDYRHPEVTCPKCLRKMETMGIEI